MVEGLCRQLLGVLSARAAPVDRVRVPPPPLHTHRRRGLDGARPPRGGGDAAPASARGGRAASLEDPAGEEQGAAEETEEQRAEEEEAGMVAFAVFSVLRSLRLLAGLGHRPDDATLQVLLLWSGVLALCSDWLLGVSLRDAARSAVADLRRHGSRQQCGRLTVPAAAACVLSCFSAGLRGAAAHVRPPHALTRAPGPGHHQPRAPPLHDAAPPPALQSRLGARAGRLRSGGLRSGGSAGRRQRPSCGACGRGGGRRCCTVAPARPGAARARGAAASPLPGRAD